MRSKVKSVGGNEDHKRCIEPIDFPIPIAQSHVLVLDMCGLLRRCTCWCARRSEQAWPRSRLRHDASVSLRDLKVRK